MATPSQNQESQESAFLRYLRFSHLGLQFAITVGLPIGVGIWLDRRLGTGVLLTILGLMLGFGAGVWALCREVFPDGRSGGKGGSAGPGEEERSGPAGASRRK